MTIRSLHVRRTLTVIVAMAAVLLGLAAIQAAAQWTATAAPLAVTPVSPKTIESKLADEQSRSADLQAQLQDVARNTEQLTTALAAAQARIDADAAHAAGLEKDLRAAKKKLAALERSIRQAATTRATATVAPTRAPTTVAPPPAGDDGIEDGG